MSSLRSDSIRFVIKGCAIVPFVYGASTLNGPARWADSRQSNHPYTPVFYLFAQLSKYDDRHHLDTCDWRSDTFDTSDVVSDASQPPTHTRTADGAHGLAPWFAAAAEWLARL